ncbi:MAG: hypothetical protein CMO01_29115 [Thalassobius sp.]|nr:hypothetical protein [Thalassovita sp.]
MPKAYLTLLTNIAFSILGLVIAYYSEIVVLIPIFFALGIPIVNAQGNTKQRLGKTFIILLISVVIFIITIMTLIGIRNFFIIGLIFGVAGLAFLGINALLINDIEINRKSGLITFFLAGISFPLYIYISENTIMVNLLQNDQFRRFGAIFMWMLAVTIGVSLCFKKIINSKDSITNFEEYI